MAAYEHVPVLPGRPLGVRKLFLVSRSLSAAVCAMAAVAGPLLGLIWQWNAARQIIVDRRVWAKGEPVEILSAESLKLSAHTVFNSYAVKVTFEDGTGRERRAKIEYSLFLSATPPQKPAELRIDPDDPERVALNHAVDETPFRWAHVAVSLAGIVLLFGVGGVLLAARMWRRLRTVFGAASSSEEVVLEIKDAGPSRDFTQFLPFAPRRTRYGYLALDDTGAEYYGEFFLANKHLPLFADAARRHVVALRTPQAPRRPVVLRSDFHPFVLRAEQRQHVLENLARACSACERDSS